MHALVVYESMYGNTREVAEAVARGLQASARVDVCRVGDPSSWEHGDAMAEVDLLVLGAPTHTWSMSRPQTRLAAVQRSGQGVPAAEPYAGERGLREWLAGPPCLPTRVAVFDTRRRMPRWLSGSAAHAMRRAVKAHGYLPVGTPASFFVDRATRLEPGELERAEQWGSALVALYEAATTPV